MNILFLTIGRMESIEAKSLYPDLLRQLREQGHQVYVVCAREKRTQKPTELVQDHQVHVLYVQIGNITKCSLIEKGISTLTLEYQYRAAIDSYFVGVSFDLVLYSTPPITLAGVVEFIKKRDHAKCYLMLKDIFPQNSLDLGMLSAAGVKGLLYRYFCGKERKLYAISDRIGCMSEANCRYLLDHNPQIPREKVEVFPNCVEPLDLRLTQAEKEAMRRRYGLPLDRRIFVYGGNLGRPQNVPFLVECLKAAAELEDVYFVVAGSGTDRHRLEDYVVQEKPGHVRLFGQMPKQEYDRMVACCDVGLIFLDHRFTIPNFPSRMLAYMQAGLPILACTDPNTDVGQVIVEGGFGWWCESDTAERVFSMICRITHEDLSPIGENAMQYLQKHYAVERHCGKLLALVNTQEAGVS